MMRVEGLWRVQRSGHKLVRLQHGKVCVLRLRLRARALGVGAGGDDCGHRNRPRSRDWGRHRRSSAPRRSGCGLSAPNSCPGAANGSSGRARACSRACPRSSSPNVSSRGDGSHRGSPPLLHLGLFSRCLIQNVFQLHVWTGSRVVAPAAYLLPLSVVVGLYQSHGYLQEMGCAVGGGRMCVCWR